MATKTVTLNTERLGKITRTGLSRKIKESGGVRKLATELNVSPKTVYAWRFRLNQRALGKY